MRVKRDVRAIRRACFPISWSDETLDQNPRFSSRHSHRFVCRGVFRYGNQYVRGQFVRDRRFGWTIVGYGGNVVRRHGR